MRPIAKGFSDHEKAFIHKQLIHNGRELFSKLGFKKTSIAELTKAAGIAQGTFYLFFQSKEELYFEIMEAEEEAIRNQLLQDPNLSGKLTKDKLVHFLKKGLTIVENTPLFQQMFTDNIMEQIMRKLPPEKLAEHLAKDRDVFFPLISKWQKENSIIHIETDVIMSLFRSLIILSFQKQMIGEEHYEHTMSLLIEFIAEGLLKRGE